MRYICVNWKHIGIDEPCTIYSELDGDQWEKRKIDVFADGRYGLADADYELGGSMLSFEPWPDLQRLGAEPEFQVMDISKEEFERVWLQTKRAFNGKSENANQSGLE